MSDNDLGFDTKTHYLYDSFHDKVRSEGVPCKGRVVFTYYSASGEARRVVDPIRYLEKPAATPNAKPPRYLLAHCHLREANRVFEVKEAWDVVDGLTQRAYRSLHEWIECVGLQGHAPASKPDKAELAQLTSYIDFDLDAVPGQIAGVVMRLREALGGAYRFDIEGPSDSPWVKAFRFKANGEPFKAPYSHISFSTYVIPKPGKYLSISCRLPWCIYRPNRHVPVAQFQTVEELESEWVKMLTPAGQLTLRAMKSKKAQ